MADTEFPGAPARAAMPTWYPDLFDSVAGRITHGRLRATRAVNTELLATYWAIGRDILDRQDSEGWGARSSTGFPPICGSSSLMLAASLRAT